MSDVTIRKLRVNLTGTTPACLRFIGVLLLALVSLSGNELALPQVPKASADEPMAETFSLTRSAEYLDAVAVAWVHEWQCTSCHTPVIYMMTRPALTKESAAMAKVRRFFEQTVATTGYIVETSAALALYDAQTTGKLHPLTRQALDRMWTLQQPDGSWGWKDRDLPPLGHDDHMAAAFAAVAVGNAPQGYAETPAAKRGLEGVQKFLKDHPAPSLHDRMWLLWASVKVDGLMTEANRRATVRELLALQRSDGGWSLPSLGDFKRWDGTPNDKNAPSDGYATGLAVFVMRQAGIPATDERIKRGVAWLKANQRESGRWFTRSLNRDDYHYISNAGTGFAATALHGAEDVGR